MSYNSLNGYNSLDLSSTGTLQPSLHQQPTVASYRDYGSPVQPSAPGLSSITTTTSAASGPRSPIFSDLFSDDLRSPSTTTISPQDPFPSRKFSGSPDLVPTPELPGDPAAMAKQDPLVTQVWKMYARTKATQPHAHRMENITWRMMALALQKKKREEKRNFADLSSPPTNPLATEFVAVKQEPTSVLPSDFGETGRGRRIDKGKTPRISVVGFDAEGVDDPECVCAFPALSSVGINPFFPLGMLSQWTGGNSVGLGLERLWIGEPKVGRGLDPLLPTQLKV